VSFGPFISPSAQILRWSDSYDAAIPPECCIYHTDQYVYYGNKCQRCGGGTARKPEGLNKRGAIRGLPLASGLVPDVATRGGRSPFFGLIASSVHPANSLLKDVPLVRRDQERSRFIRVYITPHYPAFLSLAQCLRHGVMPVPKKSGRPSAESLIQT
jgi:hypothetical protein